jgi:hypothetical protein
MLNLKAGCLFHQAKNEMQEKCNFFQGGPLSFFQMAGLEMFSKVKNVYS